MTQRILPQFIDSVDGRIFVLLRGEPAAARGCVLFVPPFGEEMNKTRRQIALTAQALVREGFSVLSVDLFGTGDSEGEFADATWESWKADVAAAARWAAQMGSPVTALVGVRLGCALAAESLAHAGLEVRRSVLWQPVESGKQFVRQFLRLRVAASMMSSVPENVEGLSSLLATGQAVEVAGYSLSPALCRQLERVEMPGFLGAHLGDIAVMEIGRAGEGELSPAGRRVASAAAGRGLNVQSIRVVGEPFWVASEIVVNPELGTLTVQHLAA